MKHQGVGNSQPEKKINKSSLLLSPEENQQVFCLLDRKCLTMCTAVVQLFVTEPPAHSHWVKRYTGALCFVKDNGKKSYFCRMYCLMKNDLVWEQEMYDTIQINKARSYLLNFEGQDGLVALNFASEDEAETFHKVAVTTVANRNSRRARRLKQDHKEPPPRPIAPQTNNHNDDEGDNHVVLRNQSSTAKIAIQQPPQVPPLVNMNSSAPRDKKRAMRKLTKGDIGNPTNFKHITHVGWTEQCGFNLTGEEAETLKPFLKKAGVSERQLNDRDTRAFIYDFIHSNNVLETVQSQRTSNSEPTSPKQSQNQVPPPVPSRQQNRNGTVRTAPPPPPVRQPPVSTVPAVQKQSSPRGPPPSRPPPVLNSNTGSGVVPPPPPPPPIAPLDIDVPDKKQAPSLVDNSSGDARSALMDSIRKGTMLKKVDPANLSTGSGGSSDCRSDLLQEIRQGKELRPASERELGAGSASTLPTAAAGTDALADALKRALEARGRVIQSSDEDSDDNSDNDDEWED